MEFQRLVEQHYAPLYRFALSLTHTESDAGDLVQDCFLTWARKGHQLQDPAKVKAWLFTTLHRAFLEKRRRLTRFPQIEITDATSELPHIEPEFARQLDGQALVALLAEVDAQYQAAVALFYLEEYSYEEIARILEVPLGTVKSRIARGIAQLRELVGHRARAARSTEGPR
jgi:RNA polymerase sigma-70 factor, ECF subfamily